MKPVFGSRTACLAVSIALIFVTGCGKKEEDASDTPQGEAKRNDVQAAAMGSGSGQPISGAQKPAFDNTK